MTSAFRTVSTFFDLSAIARERNHTISRTFVQFRTHRCAKVAKRTKCYIHALLLCVIRGINLQKNQQQKINYKLVQRMLGVSKSGLSAYKPGLHRSLFCIKA